MKIKILLSFLFAAFIGCVLAPQSFAQTPISKDTANAYFGNCMKQPDARMTTKTQEELCACTAAKMMDVMSVEDMQRLTQKTREGMESMILLVAYVYTPCSAAPVRERLTTECLADKKIDKQGFEVDKGELCQCVAEKTGQWFASNGPSMIENAIRANVGKSDIIDPTEHMMKHPNFRQEQMNNVLRCVMKE